MRPQPLPELHQHHLNVMAQYRRAESQYQKYQDEERLEDLRLAEKSVESLRLGELAASKYYLEQLQKNWKDFPYSQIAAVEVETWEEFLASLDRSG